MGEDAYKFILKISPYMIVRAAQAQIALKFWQHKSRYHGTNVVKPDGFIEVCRDYHAAIKVPNTRGVETRA